MKIEFLEFCGPIKRSKKHTQETVGNMPKKNNLPALIFFSSLIILCIEVLFIYVILWEFNYVTQCYFVLVLCEYYIHSFNVLEIFPKDYRYNRFIYLIW